MAYCELCDMDRGSCPHGLAERRAGTAAGTSFLLISPRGMAHFQGCPHKGDDPDLSNWGNLDVPHAWQRLGNGGIYMPPVASVAISSPPPGATPASITALGEPPGLPCLPANLRAPASQLPGPRQNSAFP
jgi:hypothetical protein